MIRRVVISVLLLVIAAGAWFAFGPRRVPTGQTALAEMRDIDAFRRWFNDSVANIRVVALISPT